MTNPPHTPRIPTETLHPAEQLGPLPEGNTLIANFNDVTAERLASEADRMITEAEYYLRQVAGEPSRDSDPAVTREDERLHPLTGLSATFSALTLEVGEVGEVHGLLSAVHPDRAIRTEAGEQQGRIQAFADSIFSNPTYGGVYEALRAVDPTTIDSQDKQRYDYYLRQFQDARRAPAPAAAETAGDPRQELAKAQKEFKENAAKAATITMTQEEFESLPADTRSQLEAGEHDGNWDVTLSQANLSYILENGKARSLRQHAYEAYYGDQAAGNDQLAQQMADLRQTIARSQDKESWTAVQVKGLTLDTTEKVTAFYESVKDGIVTRYQDTVAKLQALLDADLTTTGTTDQIREYDLDYYKNALIKESYDASQITFSFEKTVRGLYNLAESLLGVKIEQLSETTTPVWADGVRAYGVRDASSNEDLGTIFVDPFSRQDADGQGGKRKSGATYALRYGRTDVVPGNEATNQLPATVVVTNFKAPNADGTEAKMTMREVETLSHELLGHALQIVLARTRGPEFAGDKGLFDTNEVVSQAFEYLVKDPHVLRQLADDGTPPDVMEAFLSQQDTVQRDVFALGDMRMLRTTAFDLAMHATGHPNLSDALTEVAGLMRPVNTDGHWMRVQAHLANPYAGRYHTYLLCNDKAKNVATLLRQNSYSQEVGAQLRTILELGGQPGAANELLAFSERVNTPGAVGGVALR